MQNCFALFVFVILTACTSPKMVSPVSPPAEAPLPRSTQEEKQNMAPIRSDPLPPNLQNMVETAKEALAKQLALAVNQIHLVEAQIVTWPDSSLGCPQPGMAYAQMLTSGYLVRLEANGTEYEFHAEKDAKPFLCDNPTPPVAGTPDDT